MNDDTVTTAFTQIPRWTAAAAAERGTALHRTVLSAELTGRLERTAAELRTTVSALLIAAHARVVATVAAERDMLIGYLPDEPGRTERVLRLHVADATWTDLVAAVAAAARNAAPAQHAETRPEVVLDLSGLTSDTATDAADIVPEGVVVRAAWEWDGRLVLWIWYDRSAFDMTYAERLAGYHVTALRLLTAGPDERHDRQSLLSPAEVETQLYGLAGPRIGLPDQTFVDLFREQVRTSPDAVAAVHGGRRWTYAELERRADRIAHALLDAGLGAEDVVAVVMGRTLDWIAAAIGVFAAGGVYLPVRPDFPADRVAALLGRSGCAFALIEPGAADLVRAAAATVARPPTVLSVPDIHAKDGPSGAPPVRIPPGQGAYIYFTSGSTGVPKGALCEHKGMLNHLFMKIEDLGMKSRQREVVAQTASQCFDISLWQFAAPLMVGGTVRVIDTDVLLDVGRFLDEIVEARVTVAQIVPSYLEVLLTHLEQHPRTLGELRIVSVTGEALKYELVERWFAIVPGIKLVNAYGATEVSDDTMHEILDAVPARDFVTVGRSLRNVNTYILDQNLELLPLGSVGEIAFSGVCVGRGYINDEERTREAFVPDPFRAGTRMYRTGDYGRWLPEDRIEFRGRRDEQVKIRGFRIEIGEIESKLLAMPGLREAAVVIDDATREQRNLVAFYSGPKPLPAARVRDFLAAQLPDYMMPAYVHNLERLPLTENGKVDKKALGRLAGTLGHGGASYAAPSSPAEKRLAMLWAEVLGVPLERIGRADNFFELGGTSLAALRLLVRLDRALTLKVLVARPVLADLAAALDERESGGRGGPQRTAAGMLQALSSVANPHHTLVCFPYAGGNAVNFRSLAAELERDGIAVLGVELPGHDFADDTGFMEDVPAVARQVRAEIAERVSTPVLFWGHCAGAAPALETARLLKQAGTPVKCLLIGALLLADPPGLRKEMAEVADADNKALLARLRADNAYVELDALKPERADVVGRAYRCDVLAANRYLLDVHANTADYRVDLPVDVVVASDDVSTTGFAAGYEAWKAVSDRVTLRELHQGGHYFVSTRPADTADLVREACRSYG